MPQSQRMSTFGCQGGLKKKKSTQVEISPYRLWQSPRNYSEHLRENLIKVGFEEDPCLFISEKVICLVYVDGTLFFSPNESDIYVVFGKLRKLKLELNVEDDVAGFIGALIKKLFGYRIGLQTGLIKKILEAIGIEEEIRNQPSRNWSLTSWQNR